MLAAIPFHRFVVEVVIFVAVMLSIDYSRQSMLASHAIGAVLLHRPLTVVSLNLMNSLNPMEFHPSSQLHQKVEREREKKCHTMCSCWIICTNAKNIVVAIKADVLNRVIFFHQTQQKLTGSRGKKLNYGKKATIPHCPQFVKRRMVWVSFCA